MWAERTIMNIEPAIESFVVASLLSPLKSTRFYSIFDIKYFATLKSNLGYDEYFDKSQMNINYIDLNSTSSWAMCCEFKFRHKFKFWIYLFICFTIKVDDVIMDLICALLLSVTSHIFVGGFNDSGWIMTYFHDPFSPTTWQTQLYTSLYMEIFNRLGSTILTLWRSFSPEVAQSEIQ